MFKDFVKVGLSSPTGRNIIIVTEACDQISVVWVIRNQAKNQVEFRIAGDDDEFGDQLANGVYLFKV